MASPRKLPRPVKVKSTCAPTKLIVHSWAAQADMSCGNHFKHAGGGKEGGRVQDPLVLITGASIPLEPKWKLPPQLSYLAFLCRRWVQNHLSARRTPSSVPCVARITRPPQRRPKNQA